MYYNLLKKMFFATVWLLTATTLGASEKRTISGTVCDAQTRLPVEGVSVLLKNSSTGTLTDADGRFTLKGLEGKRCTLLFMLLPYRTVEREYEFAKLPVNDTVFIEEETETIDEVVVSARMRSDTENAMTAIQKALPQVTSGVSATQISKGSDRTASEVIRRVPGITIIDGKFIIVRGLSPRYNSVRINGLAVPGAETESRAFPFDLIPSSQIENLLVYKSPAPDLPGDFAGGFVNITSKEAPEKNRLEVGYSTGFNLNTVARNTRLVVGSGTDFFGFDNGKRAMNGVPQHLSLAGSEAQTTLTRSGFNNDWRIRQRMPAPDLRLSFAMTRRIELGAHTRLATISSLTYGNSFKTVTGMKNARFGVYSTTDDCPLYLDDYSDNQYSNDVRLGAMHNMALSIGSKNRIEFKNIFNLTGRNRLTERIGIKDMSSMYLVRQTEMLYSSRLTYGGQFAGKHELGSVSTLNWNAGYSYAGKNEPDRRIVTDMAGIGSRNDMASAVLINDNIKRYFQSLHDNALSASGDFTSNLGGNKRTIVLKTGLYGEYRYRKHNPREFIYRYDQLTYDERQTYLRLPFAQMLDNSHPAGNKVYIDEITHKTYAYAATTLHAAGYALAELTLGKLSVYAGLRVENHNITLERDRSDAPEILLPSTRQTNEVEILPSLNFNLKFSEQHQLRASCGRSVNRPELREISPTVYYDFDLFNEVVGKEDLKTAKIDNLDLRYEFYPEQGDVISIGLFYKHFDNPIEWTFIDMGGSLRYCNENARKADNAGIEIDLRKNFAFINLPSLTFVANAAFIRSRVRFFPGEVVSEPDRVMQGQSPYIINAGIYWHSNKYGLGITALYNRTGERIIGVGKSYSADGNINATIPDAWEMPRNSIDLALSKTFGKVELRLSITDLLAEDIVFRQFPKFVKDGLTHKRQQTTRQYNNGQSVSLGINLRF
jgi:hypothetical protein